MERTNFLEVEDIEKSPGHDDDNKDERSTEARESRTDDADNAKESSATSGHFDFICKGLKKLAAIYLANDFAINVLLAIALAKAYPPLGAEYVQPKITGG
jgi:hypothetical protein